jgi:8-amino-7-oxononanoate synthase
VGNQKLIEYLINFSRPFIYTTALPDHSVISISCALDHLKTSDQLRQKLNDNIAYFQNNIEKEESKMNNNNIHLIESYTAIQGVVIPDNVEVRQKAGQLQRN